MSETDDESLILELIRRIDSNLDSSRECLVRSSDKFDTSLARFENAVAEIAASQKRTSDETEDLLRLVEEYHAELIRETGGRLRRARSPVAD